MEVIVIGEKPAITVVLAVSGMFHHAEFDLTLLGDGQQIVDCAGGVDVSVKVDEDPVRPTHGRGLKAPAAAMPSRVRRERFVSVIKEPPVLPVLANGQGASPRPARGAIAFIHAEDGLDAGTHAGLRRPHARSEGALLRELFLNHLKPALDNAGVMGRVSESAFEPQRLIEGGERLLQQAKGPLRVRGDHPETLMKHAVSGVVAGQRRKRPLRRRRAARSKLSRAREKSPNR